MLIDLDLFENAVPPRKRFCIVGAGIAGLVLAQRLARMGHEVNVLEAGGLGLEERSQNLYRAEMAAAEHLGSTLGRFRIFGGSSTQWGGQLLPYTKDVFRPVAGSPSVSWPIGGSDIEKYYSEVQRILHVGALPFTEELLTALGHRATPFSSEKMPMLFPP